MNRVAAISFPNGSIINVATVDDEPEYYSLLACLSSQSSEHLALPYTNFGYEFKDPPRQWLRGARKAVGLPATKDGATLSAMLKSLQDKVETFLGQKICSAAAATLHLLALYEEDIRDAFEYINLERLRILFYSAWGKFIFETTAAYAGYGFGLCLNYTNMPACYENRENAPKETVMVVLCTQCAHTVTLSVVKSAHYLWQPDYRHLEDFSLGYVARHNKHEDFYWERVRDRLGEIMVQKSLYTRPGKVFLLRESVQNNRFTETLDEVLRSLVPKRPEIFRENASTVAARGVANLQKWRPGTHLRRRKAPRAK